MIRVWIGLLLFASTWSAAQAPEQVAAIAAEEGRPMLLRFGASWCGACEEMRRSSWPRPEVVAACAPYATIDLDADRHSGWSERYRVEGYPTLILTDPDGYSVIEWVGYMPPALLLTRLKAATARWPELAQWAREETLDATLHLAEAANELEAFEQSTRLFRQALRQSESVEDRARAQLGWSWVQARRGNCAEALRGHRRFMKLSMEDARLERVERAIERCRERR